VRIEELGPFVSAAELAHRSPGISRREARKLIDAFRQDYRQAHARIEHRLHWSRGGAVWATDFTKAPCEVADIGRALLVVRDVAGKEALGWSPARGERADAARALLTELFSHFGAPLVLKMDNGSAFIAKALSGHSSTSTAWRRSLRRPKRPPTTAPARRATPG
jgi:transposase InsO family protein